MTMTLEKPTASPPDDAAEGGVRRGVPRWAWLVGIVAVWVVGGSLLHGRQTLSLPRAERADFHRWLDDLRDSVESARDGNLLLDTVIGTLADALNTIFDFLSELISVASPPRPVPDIGWLGVVAVLVWLAAACAGWRQAVLVALGTLSLGLVDAWSDGMDLLIVTVMSVVICAILGIPLGIAMARRRAVSAVVTPILDAMQTMPAFAYLTPLALFWGIGPAAAVVTTVIYAAPPLVRITEHALRGVAETTVEAARSLGVTNAQLLRQVQLPMARRTIVLGINQCTMAALSMATIATLISGPGLGGPVYDALQSLDVGRAAVAGLAIVVIAIMLDRTITGASERSEIAARSGGGQRLRLRRAALLVGLGVVGFLVWLSRTYLWAAEPSDDLDRSRDLAERINSWTASVVDAVDGVTGPLKDAVSYGVLNPLQSLVAESPWWLTGAALVALALVLGGLRASVITVACLAVILGTGLWNDAMVTLTSTLVATAMVMVVAVALGVAMARRRRLDLVVRPVLDAFQTIPSFVYLVPVLALFDTSRFTAIVAALLYAVPIATKLVADGVRGVSATTVEAALAAGSTPWQTIWKVQLPMARESLVLAANQGLLYVLSMVVIGALVGGGGLGYLVVAGFSQLQLFGKGLAAAIALTALGIMLDRITRAAAARHGRA